MKIFATFISQRINVPKVLNNSQHFGITKKSPTEKVNKGYDESFISYKKKYELLISKPQSS